MSWWVNSVVSILDVCMPCCVSTLVNSRYSDSELSEDELAIPVSVQRPKPVRKRRPLESKFPSFRVGKPVRRAGRPSLEGVFKKQDNAKAVLFMSARSLFMQQASSECSFVDQLRHLTTMAETIVDAGSGDLISRCCKDELVDLSKRLALVARRCTDEELRIASAMQPIIIREDSFVDFGRSATEEVLSCRVCYGAERDTPHKDVEVVDEGLLHEWHCTRCGQEVCDASCDARHEDDRTSDSIDMVQLSPLPDGLLRDCRDCWSQ